MRLPRPLAITAATWYPDAYENTSDALQNRRVDSRTATELGYDRLLVAPGIAPPDMAVRAATDLLQRAGCRPDAIPLLLHASIYYQGHDMWSAPHYIARELNSTAVPIGLLQQCNGGVAGIELAATHLIAHPGAGPVLVTTADRFLPPGFDRWRGDFGMAVGDAATALLVHDGSVATDLELCATATTTAAELELMHRGNDAFDTAPHKHSPVIDVRRTKRAFIRQHGIETFFKAAHHGVRAVVSGSLAEAGLQPDDPRLRWAVLPRLGRKTLVEAYIPPLAQVTPAPRLDLGRRTGHLGAGDLNASLADLAARDLLAPGEFALLLNSGGGFTFSSVVVRRP